MKNQTFNTCTINNFDGNFFPRTLSKEYIKILPRVKYYYIWVNIDRDCDNDYSDGDSMIMCIWINDEWHQVQSIDFDFNN